MDQRTNREDEPHDNHKASQTKSENEIDSVQSADFEPPMVIVPRERRTVSEKDGESGSRFQKSG
jgi:hypothetical protein